MSEMDATSFMMWVVRMNRDDSRGGEIQYHAYGAPTAGRQTAPLAGLKPGNGHARGARRAGGCDAADRRRGTRVHPGTERVRKIHADQDDYAGMLPAGARRIVDRHPGEGTLEYF